MRSPQASFKGKHFWEHSNIEALVSVSIWAQIHAKWLSSCSAVLYVLE